MYITHTQYRQLAKAIGILFTVMGGTLLALYCVYLAQGSTPLGVEHPSLNNGAPMMLLGTVGAFALPVGLFVFGSRSNPEAWVRMGAVVMGLMAAIRLLGFATIEVRAQVGMTPLFEALIFGIIATVALCVRVETDAHN